MCYLHKKSLGCLVMGLKVLMKYASLAPMGFSIIDLGAIVGSFIIAFGAVMGHPIIALGLSWDIPLSCKQKKKKVHKMYHDVRLNISST